MRAGVAAADDHGPAEGKRRGQGLAAGTTKRADGSREVTYAGHPLYLFAGDSRAGQTTGQGSTGFGAPWWVVTPAGKALQNKR